MDDRTQPPKPQEEEPSVVWTAAALCIGYNDLAKRAESLGEKVYFRLLCDAAEKHFVSLGGNAFIDRSEGRVLELPTGEGMPRIDFTARDIELMRAAVRDFDGRDVSVAKKDVNDLMLELPSDG